MTGLPNREFPRVTVLIPTYNRPRHLGRAIRSVIAQDFPDWELLVINDGGQDVGDLVEGFADHRVRYFPQPENKGKAACRNFGLAQARGEFVAYLDDDDAVYPHHLGELVRALDENPSAGAAYSDLYCVDFVRDPEGARLPLGKRVQVSRNFNRDFIFISNHVFHVSLMHRRETALRVGGYDEDVRVFIDWNLVRKMAFVTDFVHVCRVTGEYWVPVDEHVPSDRISDRQRKNKAEFQRNIRRIKARRPPKPWRGVMDVAVILPLANWNDAAAAFIAALLDGLEHPFELVLVDLARKKGGRPARKVLGDLLDLPNVSLHKPEKRLEGLAAYRFGVLRTEAELVYLVDPGLDVSINKSRLFLAFDHLKRKAFEALCWSTKKQPLGTIDLLIWRKLFLEGSGPERPALGVDVDILAVTVPNSFQADHLLTLSAEYCRDGRVDEAYEILREAMKLEAGAPTRQVFLSRMFEIMMRLEKYAEAEKECRALIEAGYAADNWIKLGRAIQMQGRFAEALEAYQMGLAEIGLTDRDLSSAVFPLDRQVDCGVFTALLCSGECLFTLKDYPVAEQMFARASRVLGPSHWPYLWLGRLFLAQGRTDEAERVLMEAIRRNNRFPESFRMLGRVCLEKGRRDEAFTCYSQAVRLGAPGPADLGPWFQLGQELGAWAEMKKALEEVLVRLPGQPACSALLAEIDARLGPG
ncbi:MAG: glycosyltransferase [Pseudomonadota bacterium]